MKLTLTSFPRYWVTIAAAVAAVLAFLLGWVLSRRLKDSSISIWYRIFLALLLLLACVAAAFLANAGMWREYVGIAGWSLLAGSIIGGLLPSCHGKKQPPAPAGQDEIILP